MTEEPMVSLKEAATELDVTEKTVFALIRRHSLTKFSKPGDKRTYLRKSDVDALKKFQPKE
jgi:hypothetical protein